MEGGARLTEIGIVGAGIAGTTLAIACREAGLDVRLYERRRDEPVDGPLLELTANGTRVLHALGLRDALGGIAVTPQFALVRGARTGFLLTQRPLGPFSEARYGAPCCLVRAGELTNALREAARARGIPLELGVSVTDVDPGSATLTLASGRCVAHAAVAVATGTPSLEEPGLADLLEPGRWRRPDRVRVIRAQGERGESDREHGRFVTTWLGAGFAVVERPGRPLGDGRQPVELLAVCANAQPGRCPTDDLAGLLRGCHPHLAGLAGTLSAADQEDPEADVAERWQAGRAVLLGAVCHGAPTYPEIMPSAVLEDAWILSRMMERWEEVPHREFATYEGYRRARARRLRSFARSELAAHTLHAPVERWRRNLAWSLTSRFLPEIAMQKADWVYGYDCVRGFA